MDNIKFYEVNHKYINYLLPTAPHLFKNKKPGQQKDRKFIGVVLCVHKIERFELRGGTNRIIKQSGGLFYR